MEFITIVYILNLTLLVLHEIESAYEREWEILRLPDAITGFLLMHIPLLLVLFYGLIEIEKVSTVGLIIGIVAGVGGLIPFMVHKVLVKRAEHFDRPLSNIIIYANILTGIGTAGLSVWYLVG